MGFKMVLRYGLLLAALAMIAGCSRISPSKTIDTSDFCELPAWRKASEARNMARNVAMRHARQKMFATVLASPATDKMTVEDLSLQNAGFRTKLLYLIEQAPYDESEPKKGILVVTVHLDEGKLKKLIQQYAPSSLLPPLPSFKKEAPAAPNEAAKPAEANPEQKQPEAK